MTPPNAHDVLAQLRSEWRGVGRSREARASLERLRAQSPHEIPLFVVDLTGLVAALEPTGGLERLHRARILAALLLGSEDPLARRCLLQTLLPGIVAVARKLRFGEGIADNPRTFLADAIVESIELLEDWAGQTRPYAGPDLLGALRCRLRRKMLAEKSRRSELRAGREQSVGGSDVDSDDIGRRLALAAAAGVTDVDLVYARCVLGHTAAELAAAIGVSNGALHRRLVAAAKPFVVASS
ncbi:MAG TPA: hypothetical protein VMQ40_07735 [Acidimicrobiales bacterium]|jgi:hypothetical protein|nr:hypothetical protein [Acidimicrobiales bacterium]